MNMSASDTGAPLVARDTGSGRRAAGAESVVNLRRDGGGSLVPVGAMTAVEGLDGGCRPLGQIGRWLLVASGRGLRAVATDGSGTEPIVCPSALPGDALCAHAGGDSLTVMTSAGPVRVEIVGDALRQTPLTPDFPPVTLLALDYGPMTADVAERSLSKSYSGGRVSAQDAGNVLDDLTDAYLHIASSAAASGMFVQPVIARCKLRDGGGNLLYTSQPVLLGHSTGGQLAGYIGLKSDDRHVLKPYTLTAQIWKLSAVFAPSAGFARAAEVASAELWVTPQFHPYSPGGMGEVNVNRASSADADFLRVRLPGASCGLGPGWKSLVRRTVFRALARIDDIEERVAVVSSPFGDAERRVEISASPEADAAAASTALTAALRRPVRRRTLMQTLMLPPHTFTASVTASDAGTVAWGDIAVQRFGGSHSLEITARRGNAGAWKMITKVVFADGSSLSRTDQGSGEAPSLISPLLVYPSPDAVEMDIRLTSGGSMTTARFPLEADESGRFAAYMADTAVPMAVPAQSVLDIAVTHPADREYPAAMILARASAPLVAEVVAEPDGNRIRALCAAYSAGQSWEFGRCRFFAGTDAGMYSVVLGANRRSVSARIVASGTVASRKSLVNAGGEVYALVGDALMLVPPAGRPQFFGCGAAYSGLAYNALRRELLAFRADGAAADVFCLGEDGRSYRRTDVCATDVAVLGGRTYLTVGNRIVTLDENPAERTSVKYVLLVDPDRMNCGGLTLAEVFFTASVFYGSIEAEGVGTGGGRPWRILRAAVSGDVRSPLSFRPVCRAARLLRLTLDGYVSADFKFHTFKLNRR